MTEIALIPPLNPAYWPALREQKVQLALPDLIKVSAPYAKMLFNLSQNGHFVILDNGAFEGNMENDPNKLFMFANAIGAKEIVVPDVLGDAANTIRRMHEFTPYAKEHSEYGYAIVLQGEVGNDYKRVADAAASMDWVTTLCLPKFLYRRTKIHRHTLADWIYQEWGDSMEIHYLGMDEFARKWETRQLLDDHRVRSMDTSLPYVYAMHKQLLFNSNHSIPRPVGYFHGELPYDKICLKENIVAVNGGY